MLSDACCMTVAGACSHIDQTAGQADRHSGPPSRKHCRARPSGCEREGNSRGPLLLFGALQAQHSELSSWQLPACRQSPVAGSCWHHEHASVQQVRVCRLDHARPPAGELLSFRGDLEPHSQLCMPLTLSLFIVYCKHAGQDVDDTLPGQTHGTD